jgi:hypothetical protein
LDARRPDAHAFERLSMLDLACRGVQGDVARLPVKVVPTATASPPVLVGRLTFTSDRRTASARMRAAGLAAPSEGP